MTLHETDLSLSEEYVDELQIRFGWQITRSISEDWQHADLSADTPDGKILFTRVGDRTATEDRDLVYIPGFTEGIVAKAPFAGELALLGFRVVLPGQYRKKILRDAIGKKDATYSQAMNYLSVIDQSGLNNGEFDVMTHSYGSLVFQEMLRIDAAQGRGRFAEARVAMLAPAGSNDNEGMLKLGGRFLHNLYSDNKAEKEFPDPNGEMLKAGIKNSLANFPRTVREVFHLTQRQVDYAEIASSGISKIMVFGYAEDKLYPHRVLESAMETAMKHGVAYGTPIAPPLRDALALRSGKHAEHNDEQSNPRRVAAAVADFIRNN